MRNTNYDYIGIVTNNLKELIKNKKNILIKGGDSTSVKELLDKKDKIKQVAGVLKNLLDSLKSDYDNKKINSVRYKELLLPLYKLHAEALLPELASASIDDAGRSLTSEEEIATTGGKSDGIAKATNNLLKTIEGFNEQLGRGKPKPIGLDVVIRQELYRAGY